MAGQATRHGQWPSSSTSRNSIPIPSPHWQIAASSQLAPMAPIPPAPVHPVAQMQGAFEESMRETMTEDEEVQNNPYKDADKFQRRKLLLEGTAYERTVAGRWLQRSGENFHPLWKLVAQISFGMHLLQKGLARSDADVIQILQTHVDEIDGFLERTTEDFELAQEDIEDRIKHLRTPLEHGDVFDTMLGDRQFRTAIVDGNEKIEHILTRTSTAMKDSLKDIQKGLDGTRQLARFLKDINRKWANRSEEHAAVFSAMMGNTEGWAEAYKSLQQKGSDLGLGLVKLEGIVSEIQRRAGVASRRNLPTRHSTSSTSRTQNSVPPSASAPTFEPPVLNQAAPRDVQTPASARKNLPTEPSKEFARNRPAKSSQAIELPADARNDRLSMQASLVLESGSTKTRSSFRSGQTESQVDEDLNPRGGSIDADADGMQDLSIVDQPEFRHDGPSLSLGLQTPSHEQTLPPIAQTDGTFFDYGSSDTGSIGAWSAQSIGKGKTTAHIKNGLSVSSSDFAEEDEDGIVNHNHPILQAARARAGLVVDIAARSSTDSPKAAKHKASDRDSSSSIKQSNLLSPTSPLRTSNRDSNNTMATPTSLISPDTSRHVSRDSRSGTERMMPQKAPPIITSFPEKSPEAATTEEPPSPSLRELTSATVSGPDMGNPFTPASPPDKSRHQELHDRIANSIYGSDSKSVPPRSQGHSRNQSNATTEPVQTTTTTITSTLLGSGTPHITTTITPGSTQSVTMRSQAPAPLLPQLNTGMPNGPGSPALSVPTPTQYRNLSPFPSTSSRGSRRPSLPAQDLIAFAEDDQARKSGFKKLFSIKRGGRNQSVDNF